MYWFWVACYSLLGLAVILFWLAEFSDILSKRTKKKSSWQKSKERIYKQQYDATAYRSRNKKYNL